MKNERLYLKSDCTEFHYTHLLQKYITIGSKVKCMPGNGQFIEGVVTTISLKAVVVKSGSTQYTIKWCNVLEIIGKEQLGVSPNAQSIIDERKRQIEEERFDVYSDECYRSGELAQAAAAYAQPQHTRQYYNVGPLWLSIMWPTTWLRSMYKPAKDNSIAERKRELVKAGALILAEMDRLDRLEENQ